MHTRGLLAALILLTVSPQTGSRLPVHVESLLYPPLAVQARIVGDVAIMARIDAEGAVQVAGTPKGHPLLVQVAEENIKSWRFQSGPESELRVTYHFKLEGQRSSDYQPSVCKFDLPDSVTIVAPPPRTFTTY